MDFDAIITGIRKAIYGREVREYIASSMEWTRDFVTQSITTIEELLRQAEAARDAAKASQDAAKVSETNAKASENAAKASQNAAASSASAAAGSASAAKTSETNAKASENAAKTSETKAKTSETNAKASENAAKTSETNAKTSETNAKSSETEAATSAANAKTSEINAKASADSMGTSVATCTAKAKEAEASAGKAAASERNAKTSEGNAKASEDEARQLVEAAKKVVNTDKTLTIDGAPADAKTVGDKFKSIKTDWNSVTDKPETFPSTWDNVSGKPSSYPPSGHTHSYAGSASAGGDATRALGVKDYAGSQTIEIGYATAGLTTSNLTHIAGYTENGTKIKDVSKDVLKSWLGLGSGVQSSGSDYIRFEDGTQICWGSIGSKSFEVTGNVHYKIGQDDNGNDTYSDVTKTASYSAAAIIFPQPFVNGNYSLAFQVSYGVSNASVFNGKSYTWEETHYYPVINKPYTMTYTGNFTSISSTSPAMGRQATYCTLGNGAWGNYIAIGRWK